MSLSNIDIAQAAHMLPITVVAERLGIPEESLEPYGRYKAKISLDYLASIRDRPPGRLVLVTAVSPTPAGEGKTTTTVGLGDALTRIGERAMICLREPALGHFSLSLITPIVYLLAFGAVGVYIAARRMTRMMLS